MTPEQAAAFVNAQTALMTAEIEALKANDRAYPSNLYTEDSYRGVIARYEGMIGANACQILFNQANG